MARKRNEKFRGHKSHGHGVKSRRGAGKRGGKGMAGGHKHRLFWIMKNFGPDLYSFAENLVTIWRKAAHEHKVGSGMFIAKK